MSTVNITILWMGQSFEGQYITHPIDVVAPVNGTYIDITMIVIPHKLCSITTFSWLSIEELI